MKIHLIASLLNIDPSRWMFCCHYSWVSITWQAVKDFCSAMAMKTATLCVKSIDCRKGKSGRKTDTDELNSNSEWSICSQCRQSAMKWQTLKTGHLNSQLCQIHPFTFPLRLNVVNVRTKRHISLHFLHPNVIIWKLKLLRCLILHVCRIL